MAFPLFSLLATPAPPSAKPTLPPQADEGRPWGLAAAYLLVLGPFFFASYGYATWQTSQLAEVPVVVFAWERWIPLWPWTIVPYWSIDLLYGLSLFLCRTRAELRVHALRLLLAQVISITFFLSFPLRFSFERPPIEGFFGLLFTALGQFDKPFNQAPSLHISLLVILWVRYAAHLGRGGLFLLHVWMTLIGLSVLTTWQHHFIDVPTGFAAGAFCLALVPERPTTRQKDPRRWLLAGIYATVAALLVVVGLEAQASSPLWLWLGWPAASLFWVALAYATGQPATFGKEQGDLPWPTKAVLAPYLLLAWLNSRWWTRHRPAAVEIVPDLWLGRVPRRRDLRHGTEMASRVVVDCLAELPVPRSPGSQAVPMLDLLVPEIAQLEAAAQAIQAARASGPTLVCCALGYSRSVLAVAAYLLRCGQVASVDGALALVAEKQPRLVVRAAHRRQLEAWLQSTQSTPATAPADSEVTP